MKSLATFSNVRPAALRTVHHLILHQSYATTHQQSASSSSTTSPPPSAKRRAVTPFNDDGRVAWGELSILEKGGRAAQQGFNLGVIMAGAVLTASVGYFLFTDVFSPDSKTTHFNRAVDRVKSDAQCIRLLGDSKQITAHGEETYNKWRRARPISANTTVDARGNEHMIMHFYVEGPLNKGLVMQHLVRPSGSSDYKYKYLYLEVPGHQRLYLENADAKTSSEKGRFQLLGVNWTR